MKKINFFSLLPYRNIDISFIIISPRLCFINLIILLNYIQYICGKKYVESFTVTRNIQRLSEVAKCNRETTCESALAWSVLHHCPRNTGSSLNTKEQLKQEDKLI